MMTDELQWTAKLQTVNTSTSRRLQGDKITLPQSALEGLLAAAPILPVEQQTTRPYTSSFDPFNPYSLAAERQARHYVSDRQQHLPQPLTFRIVNPQNDRVVYAGIREFSAEDGEIGLSTFLLQALGVTNAPDSEHTSRSGTPDEHATTPDDNRGSFPILTVHAKQIPKGTYVKLRPLEAGYDSEDWKSLLERHLRDNFTTLTRGEVLDVPGPRREKFKFLVDKFEPDGDGVCIVDTDLEVDIEPLNEEQARETLNRRLERTKKAPGSDKGSSAGGELASEVETSGQVLPGEYVDYEIKRWNRHNNIECLLHPEEEEADLYVLASTFDPRHRSKPRLEEHIFADLSSRPTKRIKLAASNIEVESAESIFVSVYCAGPGPEEYPNASRPIRYTLNVSQASPNSTRLTEDSTMLGSDETQCKNCRQAIPKRTLPLHEAFCYRNNVSCPKCGSVYLKNSEAWKTHWHCAHDEEFGSGQASQDRHNSIFHPPTPIGCSACDFDAFNIPTLAQHRTSTCPGKEILCQFCHLVVPQQGPDDPPFTDAEVLLSGLTPHELTDGARTTECHLCSRIVRLRDMRTHLRLHDRDRIVKPKPMICVNAICGRTIRSGKELQARNEQFGLCDDCYGPLHSTTYDPEGKALRRRIERRLLQQLTGGCNKLWCGNAEWCRTGRKNATDQDVVMTVKDALQIVKPIIELLTRGDSDKLRFCVDEAAQSRRAMAEMMAAEGVYEIEWCVKALEEERNNLGRAAEWLKERAPKKGEVLQ